MKKTLAFLSALVALVACSKEAHVVEELTQKENQEIKINLNISRGDIADATKATVKKGWAENDVIFIFFNNATAPHYLELKYNKDKEWKPRLVDLTSEEITASDAITAIYLPYGSAFTVAANSSDYTIKNYKNNPAGDDYCGHFYMVQGAGFTYEDNTLTGTITLAAPSVGVHKYVHFDVSGYADDHQYVLNQDYMRTITLRSIASDGTVDSPISSNDFPNYLGLGIPGYIDEANEIVSFSGVLDYNSAVKKKKDYRFVIHDKTSGTAYSRVKEGQTISTNMYIGLGAISDEKIWTPIPAKYFSVSPTKLVSFSSGNLVATIKEVSDGEPTNATWGFHDYQYDVVYPSGGTQGFEVDDRIDLFGWSVEDGSYYGISSNNSFTLKSFVDWGNLISGYRTLSQAEEMYLLGQRGSNDETGFALSMDRYRKYGRAVINDGVNNRKGIVIIPDTWTDPKVTTFKGTSSSYFNGGDNKTNGGKDSSWGSDPSEDATNYYNLTTWSAMQSAGAIFLPAAGQRKESGGIVNNITNVNAQGYYWFSNYSDSNKPYYMYFNGSTNMATANESGAAYKGYSVRLVRDLN